MQLSTRHKFWIAVLGLGLTALAVDRFILPHDPTSADAAASPAGAAALLVDRPSSPPPASPIPSPAPPAGAGNSDSLAFLLRGICVHKRLNVATVRDAFSPPPAWTRQAEPPESKRAAPDWSRKFAGSHRLTGVMLAGRRSQALIDGKLVAIGQSVDGCKLIAVTTNSATFVREGTPVTLALDPKRAVSAPVAPTGTAMTE